MQETLMTEAAVINPVEIETASCAPYGTRRSRWMDDGNILRADVFLPEKDGKDPVTSSAAGIVCISTQAKSRIFCCPLSQDVPEKT